MDSYNIEYMDINRPMVFLNLKFYRNGKRLPEGDNIIKVTKKERDSLCKRKNGGTMKCFREVKKEQPKRKREITEDEVSE